MIKLNRRNGFILFLFVIAVLAMYHWLLLPPYMPKLLMTYDYCRYFGCQAYYLDSAIHHGEFPLWNPLTFCGTPFAASPQQTAFYPPQLIRSLLTSAPTPLRTHVGLIALVMLHSIFAGIGAYLLAREYKMSRGAAIVAGLAYMFGPHFVRRVLEQWILVAVASYLPFLWLLLRRAMYAETMRARIRYAMGGGLLLGLSVLAGFPQLTFYTAVTLGLVILLERLFFAGKSELRRPWRLASLWFRDGTFMLLLAVIGALTAAALLLPARELITGSTRITGGGYQVEAFEQNMSPAYMLKALFVYTGPAPDETGCRAAGIISLLLAFTALFHPRRRLALLFLVLYLALTDCTIGPPLPLGSLLHAFDFFQFSSPWRAGILAGLPFALLAGLGAEKAAQGFATRPRALAYSLALGLLGCALIVALLNWFNKENFLHIGPYIFCMPVAGLLCMLIVAWLPRRRYMALLLALLLFLEIGIWNHTYVPYFIYRGGFKEPLERAAGRPDIWQSNNRITDTHPNIGFYNLELVSNGYDPLCLKRVRETINAERKRTYYLRILRGTEITCENQRGNLFVKRHFWLTRQYVQGALPSKSALFPPATTVYLPERPDFPLPEAPSERFRSSISEDAETQVVLAGDQVAVATTHPKKNYSACTLPEITLDHRHAALLLKGTLKGAIEIYPEFRESTSTRYELGRKNVLNNSLQSHDVTIEIPMPSMEHVIATIVWKYTLPGTRFLLKEIKVLRDNADENNRIEIVHRGFNYVDVRLHDLPGPRCLLYVDAAYPGWQATIDGAPAQLLTANDVFKAICVQAGTHDVRFEFKPPLIPLGIAISLTTAAGVIAFLLATRKPKAPQVPSVTDVPNVP